MKKILSICIPVYNGSRLIDQTLKSILNATENLSNELFEIIISDNASNDDTLNKIDAFKKTGLKLSVIENKKNYGYDKNLDILIKNSNALFTWFLGCGEICKKNSIKKLIDFLTQKNNVSNLILDFDIFNEKLNINSCESVYGLTNDISIIGKNNFKRNRYSSALSGNVVKTKLWFELLHVPLVGVNWCHVERILKIISSAENSETYILSGSYFTLYQDVNGWWNKMDSYKILIQHLEIIDNMPNMGFNEKSHKRVRRYQEGFSVINAILQSRKNGFKFNNNYLSEFRSLFSFSFYYLCIIPVAYFPISISFFATKIFLKIYTYLKLIKKTFFLKYEQVKCQLTQLK